MTELTKIAEELWTTTRALRFLGVETGTRMTIARLPGGGLFVHSPVTLDDVLRAAVDALGRVVAVVAPSLFHHLAVDGWQRAYPKARFTCCPGLEQKRADLRWDGVLGDEAEPEWRGTLQQVHFAARPLENEVVFFHQPSRALVCSDAVFNLSAHPSRFTRLVAFLIGNHSPGSTWIERFLIRDRARAREQIDRMLEWRPEQIVLAHGANVPTNGTEVLREAYAWL